MAADKYGTHGYSIEQLHERRKDGHRAKHLQLSANDKQELQRMVKAIGLSKNAFPSPEDLQVICDGLGLTHTTLEGTVELMQRMASQVRKEGTGGAVYDTWKGPVEDLARQAANLHFLNRHKQEQEGKASKGKGRADNNTPASGGEWLSVASSLRTGKAEKEEKEERHYVQSDEEIYKSPSRGEDIDLPSTGELSDFGSDGGENEPPQSLKPAVRLHGQSSTTGGHGTKRHPAVDQRRPKDLWTPQFASPAYAGQQSPQLASPAYAGQQSHSGRQGSTRSRQYASHNEDSSSADSEDSFSTDSGDAASAVPAPAVRLVEHPGPSRTSGHHDKTERLATEIARKKLEMRKGSKKVDRIIKDMKEHAARIQELEQLTEQLNVGNGE